MVRQLKLAIVADKKQYEAKYEECANLYEIIHDL